MYIITKKMSLDYCSIHWYPWRRQNDGILHQCVLQDDTLSECMFNCSEYYL